MVLLMVGKRFCGWKLVVKNDFVFFEWFSNFDFEILKNYGREGEDIGGVPTNLILADRNLMHTFTFLNVFKKCF